jgi:hypothetical protein
VATTDSRIDDLYKQPLDQFTASRNALAKTLTGADAKHVRALAKPSVVAWAVNQVYWHARTIFDRVITSGERLRAGQIASLEGRRADLRAAGDAHRLSIAEAVKEAERLAQDSGLNPPSDALMRTFEALSLASTPAEPFGRLTKALQPSGFEALAGVKVNATATKARHADPDETGRRQEKEAREDRERERAARETARRHDAAVSAAEAVLARAEAAESQARKTWERAHDELLQARHALRDVKQNRSRSS